MSTLAPFKHEVWAPSRRYLNILRGQTITITVNGGLPENSLTQSNDSNGKFEQRSGALLNMGVATGLFIWRMCPRSSRSPPPTPPSVSQVAHGESRQRQQPLCSLSEGCVLFHINDKDGRGSKKSLSYTHLFKKRQPHNTVGGSPQEFSESRRGQRPRQWQKAGIASLFFFCPLKQGGAWKF